jgi:hypothetical protein
MFMGEDAEFPICECCAPYIEKVYSDPSFGSDFMQFLGVTDIQKPHQSGGAFSFASSSVVSSDLNARMRDFDLHCRFVGEKIQALRTA